MRADAEEFVERDRGLVDAFGHGGVERLTGVEAPELPEREPDHEGDRAEHQDVEGDPLRTQQEGTARPGHLGPDGSGLPALPCVAMSPDDITADWLSAVLGGEIHSVEASPDR